MARIAPVSIDDATTHGALLRQHEERVAGHFNFFATLANSKAAFDSYLAGVGGLGGGVLSDKMQLQIALAVAHEIGAPYCMQAYKDLAEKYQIGEMETHLNASAISMSGRTGLILAFVQKLVRNYGQVKDSEIELLRKQGVSNEEILEITANVIFNMYSSFVNHVAGTEPESDG